MNNAAHLPEHLYSNQSTVANKNLSARLSIRQQDLLQQLRGISLEKQPYLLPELEAF